jgi:pyruvate formate lyase activating enzyme
LTCRSLAGRLERDMDAMIFNIQRFSTEDGPGIRTTVFFKGCPLSCAWCHNPEGLSPHPQLVWYEQRCIGARDCLAACPEGALTLTRAGMEIDRTRCTACGECEKACPAAALEVVGKTWGLDQLVEEVLKDEAFFRTSGGGITLGGGEPALQADFVAAFVRRLREKGIHVALDTSGYIAWKQYAKMLPWVDLVLLDLKHLDPRRHAAITGVPLEPIAANARRFCEEGARMWIRTPVIPGYTDSEENIAAIARFIAADLAPCVERYDLLAFNNLCVAQYKRLKMPYPLEHAPLMSKEAMERLRELAQECGAPNVHWSGATRIEGQ